MQKRTKSKKHCTVGDGLRVFVALFVAVDAVKSGLKLCKLGVKELVRCALQQARAPHNRVRDWLDGVDSQTLPDIVLSDGFLSGCARWHLNVSMGGVMARLNSVAGNSPGAVASRFAAVTQAKVAERLDAFSAAQV